MQLFVRIAFNQPSNLIRTIASSLCEILSLDAKRLLNGTFYFPCMTLSISLTVPTDAEGVDCGALDQLLGEHKSKSTMTVDEKHPFWSMVYLIPTYNNPRGMCFPPGKLRTIIPGECASLQVSS